jgi:ribosomal protein S18 acetylase RimI-like enzyme
VAGEQQVLYRVGQAADSTDVALLHAESWRRHYRGAYSNSYLDGDLVAERMEVWAGRMAHHREAEFTLVAEIAGHLVGFIHTVLDADPVFGALIDNLHVTVELKRRGIGSSLLREAASDVIERRPSSGMFLWVLEQNVAAQSFYAAQGGVSVERDLVAPPGDDPTRLIGQPTKLRYTWSDPVSLCRQ